MKCVCVRVCVRQHARARKDAAREGGPTPTAGCAHFLLSFFLGKMPTAFALRVVVVYAQTRADCLACATEECVSCVVFAFPLKDLHAGCV